MKKGESWIEISVECPYCHHIMHSMALVDFLCTENPGEGAVWCMNCEEYFAVEMPEIY